MPVGQNLFPEPSSVLLPSWPEVEELAAQGSDPAGVAAQYPAASLAWAVLAEGALAGGRPVEAYAYARTGYHRGLDALRRSGWKGYGPVPWSHGPNQGFLRCVAALARAATAIAEPDEAQRCTDLLQDCDPAALALLD